MEAVWDIEFPLLSGSYMFESPKGWHYPVDPQLGVVFNLLNTKEFYPAARKCEKFLAPTLSDLRVGKLVFKNVPFSFSFSGSALKNYTSKTSLIYVRGNIAKCLVDWDEQGCTIELDIHKVHTNIPEEFISDQKLILPALKMIAA